MGKRINDDEYGFQTRAVHVGNGVDGETGAIKRPITPAFQAQGQRRIAEPFLHVHVWR